MMGPIDIAKLATKPRMATRISVGFIEIALLTKGDSNLLIDVDSHRRT